MAGTKQYWLVKSEPSTYSIDDLENEGTTPWTGVRNYQARNFMRAMKQGDEVLFYHSSCDEPGVYGVAKVAAAASPDASQFDTKSDYYDPKATKEKPIWDAVDISFVKKLSAPVLLQTLRTNKKLASMKLLQPGSRLSVTPVTPEEFSAVLAA